MNDQFCIYCGKREATTRDHVPPKSLFSKPRPANLITVPCCESCNRTYGKDDERIRNLLTSIDTTENHPSIKYQIAKKRNRSFLRSEGTSNLRDMLDSLFVADIFSPGGIVLGKALAFNLNRPLLDRFIERTTRALMYFENSIEHVNCNITWQMSLTPDIFEKMPTELKNLLLSGVIKQIGDIFGYVGIYRPQRANSLWVLNYYGGIEFMALVQENMK